ncbi:MAG: YeeE/YedE family protein, partial [Helicobacteraceae bacterium]|nr:YeeE/YedE family protein [Helicobacteraceae bacterium]
MSLNIKSEAGRMLWQKIIAPVLIALSLGFAYYLSFVEGGRTSAFALVIGLVFGFAMQKSRFCFYCHIRDYIEDKNPSGALALILALAIGLIGYTIVISSWNPTPTPENIPPDIHAGPVSEVLFLAGAIFGAGMVLSKSCIAAHWYHLSEGAIG